MVVLSIENAPESLRGELTRWCLEIRAGVFVGTLTTQVREILWKKIESNATVTGGMLVYSFNNEQGFALKSCGTLRRDVNDFDGISLVTFSKAK